MGTIIAQQRVGVLRDYAWEEIAAVLQACKGSCYQQCPHTWQLCGMPFQICTPICS